MISSKMIAVVLFTGMAAHATSGFADDATPAETLTNPSAFERAYATSFYGLDGCGAQLTGRIFRDVLAAKFAECPFSADARAQYDKWTRAQGAKSSKALQNMIVQYGGLPRELEGMTATCHAQTTSASFQQLQSALDGYQRGEVKASAILRVPCDAAEIVP